MVFLVRNRISELILLLLVCLAPWAFGSVEAWAELGLYAGIGLLTILGFSPRAGARSAGLLARLPSIALGGLVVLAVFQSMPLGREALSWIAPSSAAFRAELLPAQPEAVAHAPGPVVPFPAATVSLDPDSSLQTAARLAAAWLLFQCVLGMRDSSRTLTLFAKIVVLNSVLLALFAIIQSLTWNGAIYWLRPVMVRSGWSVGGPFLSHNHLAAYLNLGLGLALGLLLGGNSRDLLRRDSTTLWTAYAAGIIALGIITSHSRSGFLGLLAASLVLAIFLRGRLRQMAVGLGVVLAISGLFLALLGHSSSYAARLLTILDLGDQGYQARLEVWRAAIQAWWARPLWGCGLGAFPAAVPPYLKRGLMVFFARAENEYVDMAVEGGTVGLLLVFAFMVGISGLARRALARARGERIRGFVAGAGFGLIALAVQSCADFGSHIPAVGVAAVVLCGMIARLGRIGGMRQAARPIELACIMLEGPTDQIRKKDNQITERPALPRWRYKGLADTWNFGCRGPTRRFVSELAWLGSVLLAAVLIGHGTRNAWIENRLAGVGLPLPGSLMPTVGTLETSTWGLAEWREALQDAVTRRPNWAEGYVRLGLVHLGLYRQKAKQWLEEAAIDPREINRRAEPLWLLGAMHDNQPATSEPPGATDILSFEPIGNHLVPAAVCFLEARRCCPYLALPHAELASLDFLLVKGDPPSKYATRALRLAGNDTSLIEFLAQVAVQAGDRSLAAHCWHKELEVSPSRWQEVADEAVIVLSADEILSGVVTDGRNAVRFAERLYGEADQQPQREQFLQAAINRLKVDREITMSDRLFFEAHASAGLNLREQACERMEAALALEPARSDWREEFVDWLFRWGRHDDAHKQALIGRYFSPDSQVFRAAVDRSADALARGGKGNDEG
jgi:O-antigen ligase